MPPVVADCDLKPVAQDVEIRLEGVVAECFGLGEQDLHGQQPAGEPPSSGQALSDAFTGRNPVPSAICVLSAPAQLVLDG
jgi:hypothetical protein